MTGIYRSPVPRAPPFLNKPTSLATIWFGTRSSLLIEILAGTHIGSRKLKIHIRLHPRTSTEIAELKILKHGYPQSKHTTTGKWYNSGPLRKQLLARAMGGLKCTNHNWPSWYKWSHVISTPHHLKKTSSKQLKRRNLHLKWLCCETNDKTLCYCIYHCVQQQRYPQQYYVIYFQFKKQACHLLNLQTRLEVI